MRRILAWGRCIDDMHIVLRCCYAKEEGMLLVFLWGIHLEYVR